MKILIVGFHPYDNNMYPHLKIFIDLLKEKTDTQYFHFRERGYSFEHIKWYNFEKIIKLHKVINKDTKRFKKLIKQENFDKVIIVDHFAFSHLGKYIEPEKLIFWSHDIISYNKPYHKNYFIKKALENNKLYLQNGARLIIQDNERKELLEKSIDFKIPDNNTFLMPIFLKNANIEIGHTINHKKMILMQCGGCGAYRFTDEVVKQYQKTNSWELFIHGFIFPEIKEQINNCKKIPIVSELRVNPEKIEQIVNKCDIGFIGYGNDNQDCENDLNFYYLKFASGQMVEFLKLAKPLVIYAPTSNLDEFVREENIGICINSFDELDLKIDIIKNNYEFYSKNALECFKKYFDSNLYIDKLLEWL